MIHVVSYIKSWDKNEVVKTTSFQPVEKVQRKLGFFVCKR